jgi:hypothetical protein
MKLELVGYRDTGGINELVGSKGKHRPPDFRGHGGASGYWTKMLLDATTSRQFCLHVGANREK